MKELVNLIKENINGVVESLGYDIYHIEYVNECGHNYLRVMIENKDRNVRVMVSDCEVVSKSINKIIDGLDIKDKFFLEVSSTGVNRRLYTTEHIKRFIGEMVMVRLKKSLENSKKFKGILKDYCEDVITLKIDEKDLNIGIDIIKNINLEEIS